jgi:hypothetical protein
MTEIQRASANIAVANFILELKKIEGMFLIQNDEGDLLLTDESVGYRVADLISGTVREMTVISPAQAKQKLA